MLDIFEDIEIPKLKISEHIKEKKRKTLRLGIKHQLIVDPRPDLCSRNMYHCMISEARKK